MLPVDTSVLEKLLGVTGGGISLGYSAYLNIQALKRVGLLPAKWIPLVNLLLSSWMAGTYFYLPAAFGITATTLIIAGVLILTHGGTKKVADSGQG